MLIYALIGVITTLLGSQLYLYDITLGVNTIPAMILVVVGVIMLIGSFVASVKKENEKAGDQLQNVEHKVH